MGRTWRGSRKKRGQRKWYTQGHQAANLGDELENRVERVLQKMADEQLIDSFIRHPPHTPKKDFTIISKGTLKDVNVTASTRAWKDHYERFGSEVEIIHFHPATTDEEIRDRILQIFQ